MSFQLKIFVIFAVTVVLIFSIINYITIYFFKEQEQRYDKEVVSVYQEILKQNESYQLPPHIKKYGDEVLVDENYMDQKFKRYSKTLLMWEGFFIILVGYFFYKALSLISRKEKEYEDFLKFLFFVLSHKIGNFLSVMKTNTEILRLRYENNVIDRIDRSCNLIYDEIKKTIETVKKLPSISKKKQIINLKGFINSILSRFETEKKFIITDKDTYININLEAFETILFLLLDNAVRYSKSRIHIKICGNAIAVRNDFSDLVRGSGIGLQIVEYLCNLYNLTITYRAKGESFLVVLKFRKI